MSQLIFLVFKNYKNESPKNFRLSFKTLMNDAQTNREAISVKEKMLFGHSIAKQAVKEEYVQVIFDLLAGQADQSYINYNISSQDAKHLR